MIAAQGEMPADNPFAALGAEQNEIDRARCV
jgi:hypothetical protein